MFKCYGLIVLWSDARTVVDDFDSVEAVVFESDFCW